MIGIIATQKTIENLRRALSSHQHQVIFERAGVFEGDSFYRQCHAATMIHLDVLIIEMAVTDDISLIRGIRQYRYSKNSRIILLAAGREPGDLTVATIVGLGVWDIIAPALPPEDDDEEELVVDYGPLVLRQIAKPANYADAARWHAFIDEEHEPAAPKKEEKSEKTKNTAAQQLPDIEEVIDFNIMQQITQPNRLVTEKIIGTVVIAVAGSGRRTGTTHNAIQISKFLVNLGHKTACIELLDPRAGNQFSFMFLRTEKQSKLHPDGFELHGIDFFPKTTAEMYLQILSAGYQYVVLDLGSIVRITEDNLQPYDYSREFIRADAQILTAGAAEWDFINVLNAIDAFHLWKWKKHWNILINFSDSNAFQKINQYLNNKEKDLLQISFLKNSFSPDPFQINDEVDRLYRGLLRELLPVHQREKKRRSIFRKH